MADIAIGAQDTLVSTSRSFPRFSHMHELGTWGEVGTWNQHQLQLRSSFEWVNHTVAGPDPDNRQCLHIT